MRPSRVETQMKTALSREDKRKPRELLLRLQLNSEKCVISIAFQIFFSQEITVCRRKVLLLRVDVVLAVIHSALSFLTRNFTCTIIETK